jgi:hypothetical protein
MNREATAQLDSQKIFTIQARLCERCGRLLTSEQAVKDGYGCTCKRREYIEKYGVPQIPGQISLLDEEEQK